MLTRGKLANLTGCNIETIRYYESIGIMPFPVRSPSNYRVYQDKHVKRLHFIQHAKMLGFSTEQIRNLLALSDDATQHKRSEVKEFTEIHIKEISKKIRELQKLKKRLTTISSYCDGAEESAEDCPILISLYSDK